ncbi:MAG: HEAT repeat domain-containing protein, partial [Bryobacteraceae bacterium]
TKPIEELYDLQHDPDEVRNLAASPQHRGVLDRMRKAQEELALKIRDVGFLPEHEVHARAKGSTPFEMGHDEKRYSAGKVIQAAKLATSTADEKQLTQMLSDSDSGVRYWAATGFLIRGQDAVQRSTPVLHKALHDSAAVVRIVAAEALGKYGRKEDLEKALVVLMELAPPDRNGIYLSMLALNAIDTLGPKADGVRKKVGELPKLDPAADPRMKEYTVRLIEHITRS